MTEKKEATQVNSIPSLLETKDFSNLEKWLSMEKKHTTTLLG